MALTKFGRFLWLTLVAAGMAAETAKKETPMNEIPAQVIETSKNPLELAKAAAQLAASAAPADHQALLRALNSKEFLLKLNTEEEYLGEGEQLRLRRVTEALRTNTAPASRQTILALTQSQVFLEAGSRVELLLAATGSLRPPPPEVVSFWDRYSQPDDGFTPMTIAALFENSTEPAMRLFEKKLSGPGHETDDKSNWLHVDVMTHRNLPVVIESCGRLLHSDLSNELKSELLDVLFDYKPGVWFTPAVNHNPPPLSSYSQTARAQLTELGRYALEHLNPSEERKAAIRRTLKQIEQ